MRKKRFCNELLVFALLLAVCISSLAFAQETVRIEMDKKRQVTVKVTLKDYVKEPLNGVRINLQMYGNTCQIVPISNPNGGNLAPGIADQNGAAYFRLTFFKPGAVTIIAKAERIPEKPPWLTRFLKNVWYTFIKTEIKKVENLELFGSLEYEFEVI